MRHAINTLYNGLNMNLSHISWNMHETVIRDMLYVQHWLLMWENTSVLADSCSNTYLSEKNNWRFHNNWKIINYYCFYSCKLLKRVRLFCKPHDCHQRLVLSGCVWHTYWSQHMQAYLNSIPNDYTLRILMTTRAGGTRLSHFRIYRIPNDNNINLEPYVL